MHSEWLAMERYRIQVMELWPDGPRKRAGIASARASLEALARGMPEEAALPRVTYTGSRQHVTPMAAAPRVLRPDYQLAA